LPKEPAEGAPKEPVLGPNLGAIPMRR
jgi:hypothetical protein